MGQLLLVGQMMIHGDEQIKLLLGQLEQPAILGTEPSHVADRADIVPGQLVGESPIQAFIEQYFHEAGSSSSALAVSIN